MNHSFSIFVLIILFLVLRYRIVQGERGRIIVKLAISLSYILPLPKLKLRTLFRTIDATALSRNSNLMVQCKTPIIPGQDAAIIVM